MPPREPLDSTVDFGADQGDISLLDRGQEVVETERDQPATNVRTKETGEALEGFVPRENTQSAALQQDEVSREGLVDSSDKPKNLDLTQKGGITVEAKSSDAMSRGPPMQFWDDWVDPSDMGAMWSRPAVAQEWRGKGFQRGSKVLFTRDERNKPYLTMPELQGVAEIVIDRHFRGRVNLVSLPSALPVLLLPHQVLGKGSVCLCGLSDMESKPRPLAHQRTHTRKEKRLLLSNTTSDLLRQTFLGPQVWQ